MYNIVSRMKTAFQKDWKNLTLRKKYANGLTTPAIDKLRMCQEVEAFMCQVWDAERVHVCVCVYIPWGFAYTDIQKK